VTHNERAQRANESGSPASGHLAPHETASAVEAHTSSPRRRERTSSGGEQLDELVKMNGEWLFVHRHIYNEAVPEWRPSTPTR
jgi:hypothetical protein